MCHLANTFLLPHGLPPPVGDIVPVADGPRCVGGDCTGGGSWGTTGMYSTDGRNLLCFNCAVKEMKIQDEPGAVKVKILRSLLPKG